MSVSLERLARNGVLFRQVNERLLELSEGVQDGSMQFDCECSNEDCTATIRMNHAEYESVRAHSTFFVVASGHEILEVEKIIDRRESWTIVQKVSDSDYAAETDELPADVEDQYGQKRIGPAAASLAPQI